MRPLAAAIARALRTLRLDSDVARADAVRAWTSVACAVIGPDATLRRGYSITLDERGTIVRTVLAVRTKMKIRTRVSDGEFGSEIL